MFNNVKLGIAPIGWTNDDMPQLGGELTFEQMVSEAALAGFQGTEVGGKFPTDPAVLNKALDLRGIKIASQWFSSFLCSTPYEENEKIEQLDFLEAVGASRINACELTRCLFAEECSMFGDNKPIATDEEWDKLCDGLNKLGKIAADRASTALPSPYGNGCTDLRGNQALDGQHRPRYVYLCFDTGYFTFSGRTPSRQPRVRPAYRPRSPQGHPSRHDGKGLRRGLQVPQGGFWKAASPFRDGCVDYPGVFGVLHDARGWFIVEPNRIRQRQIRSSMPRWHASISRKPQASDKEDYKWRRFVLVSLVSA